MIHQLRPVLIVSGQQRELLHPFETHWDRDFLWSVGIPPNRCINVERLTVQRLRAKVELGIADEADAYVDSDITDWDGSLLRKPAPTLCEWDQRIEPGDRVEFRQSSEIPDAKVFEPKDLKPHWDDDLMQLSYGNICFERFRKHAWNQREIVNAFQAAGWPTRIDKPVKISDSKKLSDTVRDLNKRVEGTLLFQMDGRGEGVVWLPCDKRGQPTEPLPSHASRTPSK